MLFASCTTKCYWNFYSLFGFSTLYDFQGTYHPNTVKTSQISKDHSSSSERPPLQHRTKELAHAMKKQLQHPISKCTLLLLSPGWSWAYRHVTFFHWCSNAEITQSMLKGLPPFILLQQSGAPPSIRLILLCLDRISRTLCMWSPRRIWYW